MKDMLQASDKNMGEKEKPLALQSYLFNNELLFHLTVPYEWF